jgi:hypothetical protein
MKYTFMISCFLSFVFYTNVKGQNELIKPSEGIQPTSIITSKSEIFTENRAAEIHSLLSKDSLFKPILFNRSINPNEAEDFDSLLLLKKSKTEMKQKFDFNLGESMSKAATTLEPVIGRSFKGNEEGGCPNDNTIAISNAGTILSCVNSNIRVYATNGALLGGQSLRDFFNPIGNLPSNICDPKVVYDTDEDKFILFAQVCDGIAANSKLLVAFSKTNNPLGEWWLYSFTGNPKKDGSWFDYPRIGLSANELFITGNLFYEAGGYNQTLIYQIEKKSCYKGQNVNWQYWYNIDGKPFTLVPLSHGQSGNIGPGGYFVATASPGNGDKISFYYLTNDMSAPDIKLRYYSVATSPYEVAGNAHQKGTSTKLDVGDCRMMDGFYLNGVAHFAFMADTLGWAAIRYYRMPVSTLKPSYFLINYPGTFDYTYPALTSFSNSKTDQSTLLTFLSSGESTYPTIRVKTFDNNWNTAASIPVRIGDDYIEDCYDSKRDACRWGDYTGAARKYNSTNATAWIAASYTTNDDSWGTWIAEIISSGNTSATKESVTMATLKVSPNPVISERVNVDFSMDKYDDEVTFNLFSANGQLIKELERRKIWAGAYYFSFDTGQLSNGTYILSIVNQKGQLIKNEKIQINH